MSTYTPLPTAPELPTTSMQASSGVQTTANWNYLDKADEDATGIAADSEAAAQLTSAVSQETTSSSTAYAFTGSALGTATTQKINAESNATIKDGTESNAAGGGGTNEEEKNDDSMYECNICLDTAKDAVVSMCGHLFCWPCLHQWLETRPNRKLCPVCKAAISREKVIPLYGRNSSKQEDPRNKVPPRPAGQRTEPEPQQGFQGFGFGDGFHMSFGIGAFPFGYFASSFNIGEARPAAANRGTMQYDDEQQLSKLFLYLAFLCIAWLLFA